MPLSNGGWGLHLQLSLALEGPHLPQTWHGQNRAATREQGGNSGSCCIGDCLTEIGHVALEVVARQVCGAHT